MSAAGDRESGSRRRGSREQEEDRLPGRGGGGGSYRGGPGYVGPYGEARDLGTMMDRHYVNRYYGPEEGDIIRWGRLCCKFLQQLRLCEAGDLAVSFFINSHLVPVPVSSWYRYYRIGTDMALFLKILKYN